ncbi:hypothetical protein PM082_011606 [Marasmius tenuissimus]|nr:hypothetical protein PM082_011606 [Marasmius tenuissimus]
MTLPLRPSLLMQTLAAKCHSLATVLSITFNSFGTTSVTVAQLVRWPSLQNLRIVFLGVSLQYPGPFADTGTDSDVAPSGPRFESVILQTFDSVTLASLRKFSVAFYGDNKRGGETAAKLPFEDLLQRSQYPLTHLEICHARIVAAEVVIRVLRPLEDLVSVNLGYSRSVERGKKGRENRPRSL